MSVADLMQIPFERQPPRQPAAAAGEAGQLDGSDAAPAEVEEEEEPAPFIRRWAAPLSLEHRPTGVGSVEVMLCDNARVHLGISGCAVQG